jgi:uncharacterized SAM-binding protein YcdF (DUF218 family)
MDDWVTLSKILPQLVYPFNLSLWLLLVAGLLVILRRRFAATLSLFLAIVVLMIASSPLSLILYRQHERNYLPVPIAQSPIVGAIVVLGGDIGLPLTPRINSEIGGNRALHAFRLFTANRSKLIIISGGNVFPQNGIEPEAYYTSELLKEWGIPSEAILIEGRSRNTYENAIETKKLLQARQIDKILLVTSAFHMPRALATFRTAEINAIPSPSSYSIVNYSRPRILEWIPSLGNLGRMQAVIHEKLGILVYKYRGWIA